MGLLGHGLKGNIFTGLAVGIGALVVAPAAASVLARTVRPLAKAAIKGGFMLYGTASGVIASVSATLKEVAAEAKAEMEGSQAIVTPDREPEGDEGEPAV
ncbi:MAG: DUF5132 domain-containing protein [Alphaproteobacteria bacterium]|uniref:DUF5132 domain-containing protein n=1 Tax=Candidatus Nitrobium versatile TaxID=2884831 RepID=A0A953M3K4_9BACT|nr:DUF5132 domain-containing protein [Candidatus Nitrobium versatile]